MQLTEAIRGRRAVRDYADRAVPRGLIEQCILAAVQAPSAINLQPWSFAVVLSRRKLAEMSGHAKSHLLATLAPASPLYHFRDRLADPDFNIFYNASTLITICATSSDRGAAQDCCLAAQNMMLAAHGHGLGTCWIGFAQPWLADVAGRHALGIPTSHTPVAPIIVGFPAHAVPPVARREPDIVWTEP